MTAKVKFNSVDLKARLNAYNREPFNEVLAMLLECAPDPDSIREFSKASPNQWAQTVKAFGSLAGFSDKLEVTGDLNLQISRMGDAELQIELRRAMARRDAIDGIVREEKEVEEEPMKILPLPLISEEQVA